MCINYFSLIKLFIMNLNEFTKPVLIEPGVKYFLNETLKQCNIIKNKYYNVMFNLGLFLFFLLLLGGILLFKYKGRLTPAEKIEKEKEKQKYILSKIKQFQQAKRIAHNELITGLPQWDNEFETINKKIIL